MATRLRLHDDPPATAAPSLAVAGKGFRPFFLLGGGFAAVAMCAWLLVLDGVWVPGTYLDVIYWHAHEMVFGFAAAVIAGFLLTAVGNWTQRETVVGTRLLALAGLWLAGRLAMAWPPLLPAWGPAAIDLAFLPALAVAIGRPLVATRNRRNLVMLVVLAALWAANLAVHLDALGYAPGWRRHGCLVGVDVIVAVILIMAGRTFPMFTRNATGLETIRSSPTLDRLTMAAAALLVVVDAAWLDSTPARLVAAATGGLALARSWHWGLRATGRNPLLWILHLGQLWIPVGLLLRGLRVVVPAIAPSVATHALTVGAIGALTLGMMARVALGHSGRRLVAGRPVVAAFALVLVAALVRVAAPLFGAGHYRATLFIAGSLWIAAFALYALVYAPILTSPRIDGKAG